MWLKRAGMTFADVGRALDISREGASRLMRKPTAPEYRIKQLKALGIPPGLLPQPKNLKPGPKPKAPAAESAA